MTRRTPPACPRCGIPGLPLDGELYACWGCRFRRRLPKRAAMRDRPCDCRCRTCQDSCEYADTDAELSAAEALWVELAAALPDGYTLPSIDMIATTGGVSLALLYRADGEVVWDAVSEPASARPPSGSSEEPVAALRGAVAV